MIRTSSFLKLLLAGSGVALLLTNCTVKSSSDACVAQSVLACKCSDGRSGEKTCNDKGTDYGACQCGGVNTGGSGGSTSTAGTGGLTSTGGSATTAGSGGATPSGGAAGEAGAGDAAGAAGANTNDDCDTCTLSQCAAEFDACSKEKADSNGELCLSKNFDGTGQYELFVNCVDMKRVSASVKRQDFVDCGNEVVNAAGSAWPPSDMTPATRDLINCIATGTTKPADPNNGWSDPTVISNKWATGSCAQTSCTSKL